MRIIWNIRVGSAEGDLPVRIGDGIIRSLPPKSHEIRWWDVAEAAGDAGADAFQPGRRTAIVEILRHHGHHETQVSAGRAAGNIDARGIDIKTSGVEADEADRIAAVANAFRKAAFFT